MAEASATITGEYPNQKLNLVLPTGPAGPITNITVKDTTTGTANSAPYEMRGVGMPNGVVTASPGTYYTDITGTSGAWRWLKKTGTGNTGWVVVIGDTGWRRLVVDDVQVDWTKAVSAIRRIGNDVHYLLASDFVNGPNTVLGTTYQLHLSSALTGFAFEYYNFFLSTGSIRRNIAFVSPTTNSRGGTLTGNNGLAYVFDTGDARFNRILVLGNGSQANGSLNWVTDAAWPTTLPGTPV